MTLSLGLLNLLEQLTEHRKPIYSLDYQFLIKVCSLGTAKGRDATERGGKADNMILDIMVCK